MNSNPTIFVVDDEAGVRESLRLLGRSVGLAVETYASGEEFLAAFDAVRPGCLLLDLRMPGLSGLDLQEELARRGSALPVIFITGYGEVPTATRAMKGGALDFIEKPFSDQLLLDRVRQAIVWNRAVLTERAERSSAEAKLASLTLRERQVLDQVVAGKANKTIAVDLGVTEKTVEFHRANVMAKLGAASVAELIRMVLAAAPKRAVR